MACTKRTRRRFRLAFAHLEFQATETRLYSIAFQLIQTVVVVEYKLVLLIFSLDLLFQPGQVQFAQLESKNQSRA